MNSIYMLLFVIMVPMFISLMFIPYWTRKTESFGVTIPEGVYHSPLLKAARKQYVLITAILSIAISVIFLLLGPSIANEENKIAFLFSGLIGAFLVLGFLIYLVFHRKMKMLKKEKNWVAEKSQLVVINTNFRDQKLIHSNLWFIVPFLIVVVTTLVTFQNYDSIPDKMPMHYNFDGEVTNWIDKSYRSLLMMPIMQVYLTLLFLFINTMIAKAKQQVSANNPEESMRKNVIFRRRWSAYIIVVSIALTLLFTFVQYSVIYPVNQQLITIVPLIFALGLVIGSIVLSITTGQGGSRVKTSIGSNDAIIDRDDDRYWKLGQFYFNKNDPSLFLEKRFGVGWTVNWARPLAWMTILVIILLAVGLPLLLGV